MTDEKYNINNLTDEKIEKMMEMMDEEIYKFTDEDRERMTDEEIDKMTDEEEEETIEYLNKFFRSDEQLERVWDNLQKFNRMCAFCGALKSTNHDICEEGSKYE